MAVTKYPTSPTTAIPTTSTMRDSINDLSILNISRLLARLEQNLLAPTADLKTLRRSEYQRMRVGANIDYARAKLVDLEKSLPGGIKDAARRHEIQTDLARKRRVLKALEGVLEDVSAKANDGLEGGESDSDDEGEAMFMLDDGEDVGSLKLEQSQEQSESQQRGEEKPATTQEKGMGDMRHDPARKPTTATPPPPTTTTANPTSTLRSRYQNQHQPTATTTATPSPITTKSQQSQTKPSDQALSSSRLEQESLTDSLVTLATQLKSSSTAFHTSLENEKSVLDRAVDGLDATTASMDAAERRMGMLRRMTEGKGWWGRMLLYMWILGLWLVAILIVFLGPKLRF